MALENYLFGSSKIYLIQQGVAVPRPVEVGTTQDFTLDISWGSKPLQGRNDIAAMIARGAGKVEGMIKAAKFDFKAVSSLVFGATPASGSTLTADNEMAPVGYVIPAQVTLVTSASTATGAVLTFASTTGVVQGQSVSGANIAAGTTVLSTTGTTVTLTQNVAGTVANSASIVFGPSITVANAANFVSDGGIIYAATGVQLTPVASAPATTQYTVSNGVYTFSAADAGLYVIPSYVYTKTTGNNFTYFGQPMGYRPAFQIVASNLQRTNNPAYSGTPLVCTVFNAGIDKFSLDFKNEDWTIPETGWSGSLDFLNRAFAFSGDVN
jgi:hypothetical protein